MPFSSQVNGDLKVCFSKIWHLFANGKPHEIGFSRVWHDAPPSRAVESWRHVGAQKKWFIHISQNNKKNK